MTIEIHELDITDGLNKILYDKLKKENKRLQEQLDIAIPTLKLVKHRVKTFEDDPMNKIGIMAWWTLSKIKEDSKKALKRIADVSKTIKEEE